MRNRIVWCLILVGIALGVPGLRAQTSTWEIDPSHSSVTFQVRHLGLSTVRGSLGGVKGTVVLDEKDVTKSTVNATVETSTINTNTAARDTALKSPDFFDVAKFPQMSFKSTGITGGPGSLKLTGDLSLAGVTKRVTLSLDDPEPPQTDAKGVTRTGFSASGAISRKEFNFGLKATANPVIGDQIKFTIDIELRKK